MRRATCPLLTTAVFAATLAGCVVSASPPRTTPRLAPPMPAPGIDVQFFYDALDSYGDWIWVEPYGWTWAPGTVDPFWRPYSVGRWAWTDWGWTWVSDEDWGWACYHYGRWARVPRHGWVWIPGTEWGPAWVAWRNGPGVVGWGPLPPEVGFKVGFGIELGGLSINAVISSDSWCFVDVGRMVEPRVARYVYPVGRNQSVFPRTADATRIDVSGGRIVNHGIDRHAVEHSLGHPLVAYRIVDDDAERGHHGEVRRDEVHMWRPKAAPAATSARPRRAFGEPAAAHEPAHQPAVDRQAPAAPARPAPTAPPAVERRFDQLWGQDWRKLQKAQRTDERAAPPKQAPDPKKSLETQREENYKAAENAYREQQAERARTQRQAEKPRPTPPRPPKPKARGSAGREKSKPKQDDHKP